MFIHNDTKTMSTLLRINAGHIRSGLYRVFESSIVGCNREIQFLENLTNNMVIFLRDLDIPGLTLSCRFNVIHQKPIVSTSSGRCELGDLLVVVKYHIPSGKYEAKVIIYQIKLTRRGSLTCDVDQAQLDLLCNWPQFSFGKASDGGPRTYSINAHTLEFGSYLLEQRSPASGSYLAGKYHCYGACPYAMLVHSIGPSSVSINHLPYTRGDVHNFFSHLILEIGEHHFYQPVNDFVNALYRYAGLAPDPPSEFNEYCEKVEDDGFAIMEINIETKGGNYNQTIS